MSKYIFFINETNIPARSRTFKKTGSILLVKEIGRLTRTPLVYEYLKETGVKFWCVDYPDDDNVILGMRVQFAAEGAYQISRKTKEGLAKSDKKLGRIGNDHIKLVDHVPRVKILKDREAEQREVSNSTRKGIP